MDLKKYVCILLVLVMATVGMAGFLNLDWANTDWSVNTTIYSDQFGAVNQGGTADWLFQVIVDTDSNTDVAQMLIDEQWAIGTGAANGADQDKTEMSWNSVWKPSNPDIGGLDGVGGPVALRSFIDETDYAGDKYYIRFFDSSTQATASNVGFIYNNANNWVLAGGSGAMPQETADLTRVGGTESGDLLGTFVEGTTDGWGATIAYVPEPGTMTLLLLGILTMCGRGIKRRK